MPTLVCIVISYLQIFNFLTDKHFQKSKSKCATYDYLFSFFIAIFFLQKMTSWMMPGGSFNEADEDEDTAASDVSEQIKAVDLELQQLQFEMQLELAKENKEMEKEKEKER